MYSNLWRMKFFAELIVFNYFYRMCSIYSYGNSVYIAFWNYLPFKMHGHLKSKQFCHHWVQPAIVLIWLLYDCSGLLPYFSTQATHHIRASLDWRIFIGILEDSNPLDFFLKKPFGSKEPHLQNSYGCIPTPQSYRNFNIHYNLFFTLIRVGSRHFSCVFPVFHPNDHSCSFPLFCNPLFCTYNPVKFLCFLNSFVF